MYIFIYVHRFLGDYYTNLDYLIILILLLLRYNDLLQIPEGFICDVCIVKLRDMVNFKTLVLETQSRLRKKIEIDIVCGRYVLINQST